MNVYQRIGGFTMSRGQLPSGDRGTRKTLDAMRQLALDGSKDLEVRETAINTVRNAGVRGHDTLGELGALYRFVRDEVRFTNDIAGVELLQSPRYTLYTRAGDCDDRATLLAALARSVGIHASLRFRAIATRGRNFSHVYVVASVNGRDIPLDPTYEGNPVGREYPRPTRIGDFAI